MPIKIDHTNKKYGHLTALSPITGGGSKGRLWLMRCDCGNTAPKRIKYVTTGRIKTCGNCELGRRLMSSKARSKLSPSKYMQKLYNHFIGEEMDRGVTYLLPLDLYIKKIKEDCVFCGQAPVQRAKGVKLAYHHLINVGSDSTSQVVTDTNYHPACNKCTRWKGQDNYLKFLEHVIKIYQRIK